MESRKSGTVSGRRRIRAVGALLGLTGMLALGRGARADEPIAQAMWVHGNSVRVENAKDTKRITSSGWGTDVYGISRHNWCHFAIPTPVIVADRRLRLQKVMLRFATQDDGKGYRVAWVTAVHVWDGDQMIATFDGLRLSGDHPFESFEIPELPAVRWGLGISVQVLFNSLLARDTSYPWVRFISAGADFVE